MKESKNKKRKKLEQNQMKQRTKRLYKKLIQQRAGSLKRLIKLMNPWLDSLRKKENRLI